MLFRLLSLKTYNSQVLSSKCFDILSSESYSIVVIDVNQCESATTTVITRSKSIVIVSRLILQPAHTNDGDIDLSGSNGGTGVLQYRIG